MRPKVGVIELRCRRFAMPCEATSYRWMARGTLCRSSRRNRSMRMVGLPCGRIVDGQSTTDPAARADAPEDWAPSSRRRRIPSLAISGPAGSRSVLRAPSREAGAPIVAGDTRQRHMQKIVLHLTPLRSQRTNRNRENQLSTSLNVLFLAEALNELVRGMRSGWSDLSAIARRAKVEALPISYRTDSYPLSLSSTLNRPAPVTNSSRRPPVIARSLLNSVYCMVCAACGNSQ